MVAKSAPLSYHHEEDSRECNPHVYRRAGPNIGAPMRVKRSDAPHIADRQSSRIFEAKFSGRM